MMNTPEQASTLWCPMARVAQIGEEETAARCIADQCAMWRWEHATASVPTTTLGAGGEPGRTFETRTVQTHGYCGLAPMHGATKAQS